MLQICDGRATKLLSLSNDDVRRLGLKPGVFVVDPAGNIHAS